jgi:hypothetical protein
MDPRDNISWDFCLLGGDNMAVKISKDMRDRLYVSISYLLENEQRHWEEHDKPDCHMYIHALKVQRWMKRQRIWKGGKYIA